MRILITGAKGFLARELNEYFSAKGHEICLLSRASPFYVDITDSSMVSEFFDKEGYFDIVFHTAIRGAKDTRLEDLSILSDNLSMYQNLVESKDFYGYMFNFCSGTAFEGNRLINEVREDEIEDCRPKGYYGLSKNIIAQESHKSSKIFNFRLFGCFGKYEEETRFIKQSLLRIKEGDPPRIHRNKRMDFFYAKDVATVLDFYLHNENIHGLPQDINLVYPQKYTLVEIAGLINNLTGFKKSCIIESSIPANPYCGNGDALEELNLSLLGISKGIEELRKHVFGEI